MRKEGFYFGERKLWRTAAAAGLAGSLALMGCAAKGSTANANIPPDATVSVNCDKGPKSATLDFSKVKISDNILLEDTKVGGFSAEVQLRDYSSTDVTLGLGGGTKVGANMGEKLEIGFIPDYDFIVIYGLNGKPGLKEQCAS